MDYIIIFFAVALCACALGIIPEHNGITACCSAVGFVAWIGFAYMVTECVPQREAQVVLYGLSIFPLLNAIYRYTKWTIELREESNWQFLLELLKLCRGVTSDQLAKMDTIPNGCKRLLQLFIQEDLPKILTHVSGSMEDTE